MEMPTSWPRWAIAWGGSMPGWLSSARLFGLFWIILSVVFSGALKRTMPYGPYLAVSTLLVVLFKPLIKLGLSRLYHAPIDFP